MSFPVHHPSQLSRSFFYAAPTIPIPDKLPVPTRNLIQSLLFQSSSALSHVLNGFLIPDQTGLQYEYISSPDFQLQLPHVFVPSLLINLQTFQHSYLSLLHSSIICSVVNPDKSSAQFFRFVVFSSVNTPNKLPNQSYPTLVALFLFVLYFFCILSV